MDAYVFQAALLCEDCARAVLADREPPGDDWDSDDYPAGPHSDGGGEADSPQHCDECGTFLENPLTPDGEAYLLEALRDAADSPSPPPCLDDWVAFYRPTALDYYWSMSRERGCLEEYRDASGGSCWYGILSTTAAERRWFGLEDSEAYYLLTQDSQGVKNGVSLAGPGERHWQPFKTLKDEESED